MFWQKKKEIVLNCYTSRADVYNYFPVVEAKKKIPSWFKKLANPSFKNIDRQLSDPTTLKQCVGFVEYFKKGFMLPMWSDLALEIGAKNTLDYSWQYSDLKSEMSTHHPEQTNCQFDPKLYQHLKLASPWYFSCEEDISFLAVEPGWQFDLLGSIRVLSGIVDFKYQASTNINIFCLRQEKEEIILLKAGMPLYHFIPLTDRKIVLKTHLVSDEQFEKIGSKVTPITFIRHYEERKKILKNSGCPFQHELSTRD